MDEVIEEDNLSTLKIYNKIRNLIYVLATTRYLIPVFYMYMCITPTDFTLAIIIWLAKVNIWGTGVT